ncbi:chloride channel protein [Bacterioplanes sanyensis]|nr:chloride channel protein [Bacterioplanes sanyensis]
MRWSGLRQHWQQQIALSDSQIGLALLALLVGLASAGLITLFRLAIEWPLVAWLPMQHAEHYEALQPWLRAALVCIGGAVLLAGFYALPTERRHVGVAHVLQRMEQHQGYLPLSNMLVQFVAAVVALISGHSAGREGPAIHLGAGVASQMGQRAGLAHHRLRILAGCGVASAISASFNTPMAGVIFAMEVVLLEYSIRGFIPIILASVAGAIVSEAVFGAETAFLVPELDIHSLKEIPVILLLGILAGIVASSFILLVRQLQQYQHWPLWLRWGGLTLVTALISFWLPELLGIGYDTVNAALLGELALATLALLLLGKLLLAAWAAGVGFPAGLIGPVMFIGALLGAMLAQVAIHWFPDYPISAGFYAILGMAAVMAASLRAPLAALVALLELTANPNIIMPGMLAIVIACLVVSEVFHLPSVFKLQPAASAEPSAVQQLLRNTWVAPLMQRSFIAVDRHISITTADYLLGEQVQWLLLSDEHTLLPAADLAHWLTQQDERPERIDLLAIPAEREQTAWLPLRANLQDALDQMQSAQLQWLAITRREQEPHCLGLLSREQVEHFYRYQPGRKEP